MWLFVSTAFPCVETSEYIVARALVLRAQLLVVYSLCCYSKYSCNVYSKRAWLFCKVCVDTILDAGL